jgi:predicted nucleic acid-binding protein
VRYLIDTCVISELRKKIPNQGVIDWFAERSVSTLYLSVLSLGELRKGITALEEVKRRETLLNWLESDLPLFFSGRILSIDTDVANRWGDLLAVAKRPMPAIDSLIVATASLNGMSVVTRNQRDFEGFGVEVINPWR